ncbi:MULTISPECIES: IS3 family transposase [Microvirga]
MTPARGREIVDFVRTVFRVSIRRACRAVPAPRSTYHYRSRRPQQAALRKRIRGVAEARVRYGYRRIWIVLRREGWPINAKRVYRLYKLEGLPCATNHPGDGLRPRSARTTHRLPPPIKSGRWTGCTISSSTGGASGS